MFREVIKNCQFHEQNFNLETSKTFFLLILHVARTNFVWEASERKNCLISDTGSLLAFFNLCLYPQTTSP